MAVNELLLDFIFAYEKACWSFSKESEEMECPLLWCAICVVGVLFFNGFFFPLFYTFDGLF